MLEKAKKGIIGTKGMFGLGDLALGLVVLVVTVAVGLMILAGMLDTNIVGNNSNATQAIQTGTTNLGSIMQWVGIIVLVVVASVILGILRSRGAFGGTTGRA